MDFFEFSDYPREERLELLRAMEAYYADFRRDQLGPGLTWMRGRRAHFLHRRFRGGDRADARGARGDGVGGAQDLFGSLRPQGQTPLPLWRPVMSTCFALSTARLPLDLDRVSDSRRRSGKTSGYAPTISGFRMSARRDGRTNVEDDAEYGFVPKLHLPDPVEQGTLSSC